MQPYAGYCGLIHFLLLGDRDNDSAGLGDWYPSKKKFPNGLKPLADHVHDLGMKFGVWFEPESVSHYSHTIFIVIMLMLLLQVNPNSNLYREHPDWVLYYDGVPRYVL